MRCNNPFAFRPGPVSFWTTIIYIAIAIPLIYVHESVPPAPSNHSLYRGLNLTEAWLDLQTITTSYHPFNSHQNDLVREFLMNRSMEILHKHGVPYSVREGTGCPKASSSQKLPLPELEESQSVDTPTVILFDDLVSNITWTQEATPRAGTNIAPLTRAGQYFEGNNFYIYIRGKDDPEGEWWLTETEYRKKHGNGGVLVNCHFDSVSTGFGATDDGMSCVSMLQMLSYFTSGGNQPRNGLVLLFNNAEEDGLLGARAFGKSPVLNFCHTFVNLEGAGAGGRAMLFRTTDLDTAKAYSGSPHPFGNVMAGDAFKAGLIKSATDYEVFADTYGQRGLDIAFYAPRARYHTEEDDTRHSSVDSIWHMLSAALATTEKLAQTTGTKFKGSRSDHKGDLVQNGRQSEGVWFDIFGSSWVAFPLRGLFAWSLTLLVATPLVALVIAYQVLLKGKFYFFSRYQSLHSEDDDDPIKLGGWRGFFRFPIALVFAGGLTTASAFLVARVNPFIVYSSSYAVWIMTISLFYFALWLVMRGSSIVRPSALQRGYAHFWLFFLGWVVQVFAAVAEDRMHIGALYPSVFLQTGVFLCLLLSLVEQLALPGKQEFAQDLHDAHRERDHPEGRHTTTQAEPQEEHTNEPEEERADDADEGSEAGESAEPTETTPLRSGLDGYGSSGQPTFASTYRQRSISSADASAPKTRRRQPYDGEQAWSGPLPSWTWLLQFFLLVVMPLILFGNLALSATSALQMTGTDGGSLVLPILNAALLTMIMLLPITPFIHRVTHHVPLFLLLVFFLSLIYNLTFFPFSANNRFKFSFQEVVDLDRGSNIVTLTGVEEYIRTIIRSVPVAAGQDIKCKKTVGRDLMDCSYDAAPLPPNLVEDQDVGSLMSFNASKAADGKSAALQLDAVDTRTCYLDFSQPIFGFSVEGGSSRDSRFGAFPADGIDTVQVWRRDRSRGWNITVSLTEDSSWSEVVSTSAKVEEPEELGVDGELKARSLSYADKDDFHIKVRCAWSDANKPSTIPALRELKQYMPTWATVTKRTVGLVEVTKTYKL